MLRFVFRRALASAIVLVAVSILTFLIFEAIPNGDPAVRMAGQNATPATIAAIRRTWGFDTPIWHQYLVTMEKVLTGSVVSYVNDVNVLSQIERGLPATLSLALGAIVLFVLFSVVTGLIGAAAAGKATDRVVMVFTLAAFSTPTYVVGAVLLYLLAYQTGIAPSGGYVALSASPAGWLSHLILPWIALAIPIGGASSRVLRGSLLENLNEDYVRTAKAKGLSRRRVLLRHVLRNSLIPLVSIWGLDFAGLIGGGAILIETIFNLHGVGQYAAQSVGSLDVPPILVITLYGAGAVVVLSAAVDVLYALLDPRIRLST